LLDCGKSVWKWQNLKLSYPARALGFACCGFGVKAFKQLSEFLGRVLYRCG
jgi:hypothetical protein